MVDGLDRPNQPHLNAVEPYLPIGAGAVGVRESLSILEAAIAERDAGVGVIHCSAYLNELLGFPACSSATTWSSTTPGGARLIWTPNGNLVVPGYGYDGSAPIDENGTCPSRFATRPSNGHTPPT